MANKQLINGKVYDWSSVTITASGMENMEPMEISYDDERRVSLSMARAERLEGMVPEIRRTPSSCPYSVRTSMRCAESSSQRDIKTFISMSSLRLW